MGINGWSRPLVDHPSGGGGCQKKERTCLWTWNPGSGKYIKAMYWPADRYLADTWRSRNRMYISDSQ